MNNPTDPKVFMCKSGKSHSAIAGEMADDIKKVIYEYSDKIPLALAIGVLRIVEREIIDNAAQSN